MSKDQRRWFAGVDWASEKHDVVVTDCDGKTLGRAKVEHSGEGLARMADWLVTTTGAEPQEIHVGIEVPHGPVVDTLLERGFPVHSINPKQVDRFRDRFTVAGAKDDSRDCDVIASSLRTDGHSFRQVSALDPTTIALKEWSRMAEEHGRDLRRYVSRLREQLQRYFPALLQLGADLDADWVLELIELAPTPEAAARLSTAKVKRVLKRNRAHSRDAGEVLAALRRPAIVTSAGTTEAAAAHVAALLASIRLAKQLAKEAQAKIEQITSRLTAPTSSDTTSSKTEPEPGRQAGQRDPAILLSFPGIGRTILATLLTEAPDGVRNRDYDALRCQAGVAPVTKQSGKSRYVQQRYACNRRLSNAVHNWARVAIQHDPASKAKYDALRGRGKSWGRALRGVADRLLFVVCAMLKHGTTYNPQIEHAKPA